MSHRFIIFHKPYGVLSQFTSELPGQRNLTEFDLPRELYAAGRLDQDSEGLLLLTNDGPLIQQLLEPGNHERTYLVQVEGILTEAARRELETGVTIQGYQTLPAKATIVSKEPDLPPRIPSIRVRKSIPTSWIELTLREGKNRQVRRMTAAVGFPTLRLIRVRIGAIELGTLAEGCWRELTQREVKELKEVRVSIPP
ncbi:MAG TPA: pseudouridine synthase [Candidatus Kapabacteria bacterium]